jgi:hypothetical protein
MLNLNILTMNILITFYDQNCSGKSSSRPDVIDLLNKHIFTVPGIFVNKPVFLQGFHPLKF